MSGKKILIIGGGFGGVAAAIAAREKLDLSHQITLIDRNKRTYICGSFPSLIVGEREPDKVSRSLGSLTNRGIQHITTEAYEISATDQTVKTSDGIYEYDYLIISTGVDYDWEAVPGSSNVHSFYDLVSAQNLRRKLKSFRDGKIVIAVSSLPYKCPPAPFETAMMMDWYFRKKAIRNNIDISVFTPEPMPIGIAGKESSSLLSNDLSKKDIELKTGISITEISKNGHEASFSDGNSLKADLIITIPTHVPSQIVKNANLISKSGWIDVSPQTLELEKPGIYAIGDINNVTMANGFGLPKAGVFASAEGKTVGSNIAAQILDEKVMNFNGIGHCFIAYDVSKSAIVSGNFLATGKPDVKFQTATAKGYREKERFEKDWRKFKI